MPTRNNNNKMTLQEAILARYSVRSYSEQHIDASAVRDLQKSIKEINASEGLHFQLVLEEPHAFTGLLSYGKFKGVRNYIVCAGRKGADVAEKIGYYGERLVLEAQTLGLGTCWVGLTYRKTTDAFTLGKGEKVYCVISLGYATDSYRAHKQKPMEKVSNATEQSPLWFKEGVEAALLAPTAINQQKFFFELSDETRDGKPVVIAKKLFSIVGYTDIDLGIAKQHFEIGSGEENFVWAER